MFSLLAALPDAWLVGFGIFQLVFSAFVSISIAKLTSAQRRYEGLEGKLHETTTKLIDERFRAVTHQVSESAQSFVLSISEMKSRVNEVDQVAVELRDRDQKNEITLFQKLDLLKDFIRDNAASKRDLEKIEHNVGARFEKHESNVGRRFEKIDDQVSQLSTQLARKSS